MKTFLAMLLATCVAAPAFTQSCSLQLAGHVTDADTRESLSAASVLLRETGKEIVTDQKGDFLFEGLCPGLYTLVISHVGCEEISKEIRLNRNAHYDLLLPHARNTLGEVTVQGRKNAAGTGFRQELGGSALEETRGFSLAESLARLNGVSLLQTGSTIAKPVIHGLHSNRILTINNGVRQEGQQWGNEHAPEIDPFIAGKLVVIKGVDELKYGSDAIGGVILVEPREMPAQPGKQASIYTGYFSNNRQYLVSGSYEERLKKKPFAYRLQGTYKKAANVQTPGYRLNNTSSEEKNFSVAAAWNKPRWNTDLFYSYFDTRIGIFTGSHIGNLTDLEKAIGRDRPDDVFLGQQTYAIGRPRQQVAHHLLKFRSVYQKNNDRFTFQASGQYNHRQEFDIVRSSTNRQPQLDLSLYTFAEDIGWERTMRHHFSGSAGLSFTQQDNSYGGRYFIPNYFLNNLGAYYLLKWNRQRWELQGGVRYDRKTIQTTRLKSNSDTINRDFTFSTSAASFNAAYKAGSHWKLNTSFNLSSRAPQVNELLSDGIHHGTATYEKGNTDMKPERSVNIMAGIYYANTAHTLSFELNAYSNRIKDFIYQQPLPETPVLTIAGAFPLIQYRQTDAVLNGLDAAAQVSPGKSWLFTTKAALLYARNRSQNDWLIGMPPARFTNALSYTFGDNRRFSATYISVEMIHAMRQSRVPDDTNGKQDYKDPPPAYTIVNTILSTTVQVADHPVTCTLSVQNIFNKAYRNYLNSLRYFTDEMGRNISLRIKIPLTR